jgi:hypothetical protein
MDSYVLHWLSYIKVDVDKLIRAGCRFLIIIRTASNFSVIGSGTLNELQDEYTRQWKTSWSGIQCIIDLDNECYLAYHTYPGIVIEPYGNHVKE